MRTHDDHTGLREQARLVDERDRALDAAKKLRFALLYHANTDEYAEDVLAATAWVEYL